MPSANKTENYGLNQWQGNEYIKREDFNTDNAIIDTQLKNVNDKADGKINKSLATAASQFLVSSAAGQWAIKTITEIKTLLGLGTAAEKNFNTAGGVASYDTVNTHLSDYVRQPGYGVTVGSANTYAVTLSPAPTSYIDGMGIVVKINVANTGAATINVNGLGAKPMVDGKGNALTSGKLRLNGTYSLKYNSTSGNFILQGEGGEIPKLPNLVKNGSFENDLNCFVLGSGGSSAGFSIVTSTKKYGSKSLFQSTRVGNYSQDIPYIVGHKYYVIGYGYFTISTAAFAVGYYYNNGVPTALTTPSTLNTWLSSSAIFTCNGAIRLIVGTWASGENQSSYHDGFMIFDLTEAFGAGNEPSKEEIDVMVENNGGWWDSDLPLLTSDADAWSSDILNNKVAYVNGLRTIGSMPNHPFNELATEISGNYTAQRLYMKPAQGYWDGLKSIYADDPNFIAANIVSGKSIFGLTGSFAGKRWASGTIVSSSTSIAFEYRGGGTATWYSITVSGLTFKPSFIMVQLVSIPFTYVTTYDEMGLDYPKSIKMFTTNTTVFNANIIHFKGDAASASVTNTGFVLPVNASNATYSWIAFE